MALILDPTMKAQAAKGPSPEAGDVILDGDTPGFARDVIEASMHVPVIVDFWAPWCGPCKQLTPALEKLVRQAGGLVRLVKINIDENQNLAAQLRIQSVPTVYAFVGGQPVDAFVGAQPESQLRAFIDRLTAGAEAPIDQALDAARDALDNGDPTTAQQIYAELLNQDPTNPKAVAGMVRALVAQGDAVSARQLLDGLSAELRRNAEIAAAASAVELAEQSQETGDIAALRSRVAADGGDHQARYDLAVALFAGGKPAEAIDELIESVRRDRTWSDEEARKQLVKIFDALGPTDPLTVTARRRLSSILFS